MKDEKKHRRDSSVTGTLSRREFLGSTAALGATASLYPFSGGASLLTSSARGTKPNIIFILADDMGYGDLNCQNPDSRIPTPNLDMLAEQGVRFTDAHSTSAVCSPSRYSILTGRYCWRTRLKRNVLRPWDPPLIEPDRLTVPAFLKNHGYHTACIGKWHLGMDWPTNDGNPPRPCLVSGNIDYTRPIENGPVDRGGFDYYFGVDVPNYPPYCYIENDHTVGIPAKRKPLNMFGDPGPMLEGWDLVNIMPDLTSKAAGYVDEKAKSMSHFFLYFPLTAPHTPIAPAPEFRGKSEAGPYGDYVYQVDDTVGRIMDALKRNGIQDNTLIIFTSDNGSPERDGLGNMTGRIGSVKKLGHYPNGELRGRKWDAWDGGHRTPFIARWPGRIKPDTTCDETISQVDLMATVAAILEDKIPATAGQDSYDISPALFGEPVSEPIREATVHHSVFGVFAIRQGRWKLIPGRGSGGLSMPPYFLPLPGQPKGQLYDMEADISETRNLYNERPDVVKHLSGLLDKYMEGGRSAPRM